MFKSLGAGKPFCLLKRRSDDKALFLSGTMAELDRLADIPRKSGAEKNGGGEVFDTLSILPFRQVEELGFVARHNDEKILCLQIETQRWMDVSECLRELPDEAMELDGEGVFSPDDDGYAARVRRIIDEEIGRGEGCDFVVPRRFRARIKDFGQAKALGAFKRLLLNEYGVYWSFIFYTGKQYFIGATPERHISCQNGVVKMNPISGTLRKTENSPETIKDALQKFLKDPKEIFELLMTVDEELKMMAEICSSGGQVVGPMLKEMSKLIHSEYVLVGKSERDIVSMLRASMFATTVTGSPIENACRVIYRNDPESRRYYGSALAIIGRDDAGRDTLDSPITIRMAEISEDGRVEISVGATIVRNSVPKDEAAETHAKAAAIIKALGFKQSNDSQPYMMGENLYSEDTMIALSSRNRRLSRFWIEDQGDDCGAVSELVGKRVVIIDNEDNFIKMMAHMIRPLGAEVKITPYDKFDINNDDSDIVILGPGPGDPRDKSAPKIKIISEICRTLLRRKKPLFCVCLGHQVLCQELGLELARRKTPFQGTQELINLWGVKEHVGFYNTFVGKVPSGKSDLEISCDEKTGEIHAVKGEHFVGVQFHPESILTTNGLRIIRDILAFLMR